MNQPIISICIPTYSRAENLKECLDGFVCQFKNQDISRQVEIIVSDNASEDNTREVVEEFQKQYSNIKYFRNDTNIGSSKNFLSALNKASGKYVWLFGDDDVVEKNSLKLILRKIGAKNYSAILLNFSQGEHYNPRIKILNNSLRIFRDKEYPDSKLFFLGRDSKNFYGINALLAIILNREEYQKNKEFIREYLGTCYYQSYAFLITALTGPAFRIAKPLAIWRTNLKRRVDADGKENIDERQQLFDYVKYAKKIGYEFNEEEFYATKDVFWVLKDKIFAFLIKYNLIKFARPFYRAPRLMRYYFNKLKK